MNHFHILLPCMHVFYFFLLAPLGSSLTFERYWMIIRLNLNTTFWMLIFHMHQFIALSQLHPEKKSTATLPTLLCNVIHLVHLNLCLLSDPSPIIWLTLIVTLIETFIIDCKSLITVSNWIYRCIVATHFEKITHFRK